MKILAVDTSSILASACLLDGSDVRYKEDTNEITHSERLLRLIDSLLSEKNVKISDLDYLMTSNGPGSFTGARIGVVTIKGLAMPTNIPIISLTTIEAVAFSTYLSLKTTEEKVISYILDAKNERAYYGAFKFYTKNSKVKFDTILEVSNDTLDVIKEKLSNIQNVIVASNMKDELNSKFDSKNINIIDENITPNASSLIDFYKHANEEVIKSHISDTYSLDIVYARKSQAERMKNGEKN